MNKSRSEINRKETEPVTMTATEKQRVTEAIDDIAYHSHELAGKCKDLATFLVPDAHKHAGEIRRTARLTGDLAEAIENAYGNLPRIDEC